LHSATPQETHFLPLAASWATMFSFKASCARCSVTVSSAAVVPSRSAFSRPPNCNHEDHLTHFRWP